METGTAVASGFPICSILTIIFVIAKLTGKLLWSWWWILSPLWIPWVLVIGVLSVMAFFAFIVLILAACSR